MPDPTASNVVTGQPRVFLFLQGPLTPFFRLIADGLEQRGHRTLRINLWFGDWLHWRRPGATNYRGRLGDWPAFITDYLDREKVTDVLLLGEQRAYHAAAIAAAKERGIQVVATDFGYLRPDWITFERDGMSAASQFPRDPSQIRALAQTLPAPDLQPRYTDDFWNMVRLDMIYHLSGSLMRPLYPFYRSHQVHHPILVYIGTGLHLLRTRLRRRRAEALVNQVQDGRAPYFVFPLQLQNDFQIRAYSPYPRLESAIREVLSSFAGNAPENSRLVIKEHPLDPAIINWRRVCQRVADEVGIGSRVDYLDGGSLQTLLDGASGVITINSTVGIWALLAGRPLKAMGSAVYDVPGLTHQGSLDEFWSAPEPVDTELRDDFVRALAGTIQIRGVYYAQPGLDAAVNEAVERLDRQRVNDALDTTTA